MRGAVPPEGRPVGAGPQGRRVFVMVSFLENPEESPEERERVRQAVDADMLSLNPDEDVSVLFRSGPAAGQRVELGRS